MNYIVLLTCAMCLVTYMVMAVILRKLDQLDVSRVRVIPFCGKGGRFKYEILVKTGWGRGSGERSSPSLRPSGHSLLLCLATFPSSDRHHNGIKQGLALPNAV